MALLLDILSLLLCAAVVGAVVWIGLLLATRSQPGGSHPEPAAKPSRMERLLGALGGAVVIASTLAATAAQIAFGAPVGSQSSEAVEVLEVRDCSRRATGFGLIVSCELSSYRDVESSGWLPYGPETVLSGEAVEPGDQVAEFTPSGWDRLFQPTYGGPQWRPVEDAGKPDLRWLPYAGMLAGFAIVTAIGRWRRSRSGQVDSGEALRGPG